MDDDSLHYTPLPQDITAAKSKLPIIVIGVLVVLAIILGVFYYLNVMSVPTQKPLQTPTATPTTTSSDEVSIFSDDAGIQELACLDWQKYKARLDQIGMVCTTGCCPWTGMTGSGCSAPAEGECKPKGNPCSDVTCWECRFDDGLRFVRYQGNQWVSCSSQPTTAPSIEPKPICATPNQCLPLNECETPPSSTTPIGQCPAANHYCCKPKIKTTPQPSTTDKPLPTVPACTKPTLNIEVECLQCDGEASTQ